ncbi:hypothetical protein Ptr902_10457 [Pyrenophora tritici-repentis]|nr:hypothetical protein Ptr902_10457 [Pyrenophora tritici-repentis]
MIVSSHSCGAESEESLRGEGHVPRFYQLYRILFLPCLCQKVVSEVARQETEPWALTQRQLQTGTNEEKWAEVKEKVLEST